MFGHVVFAILSACRMFLLLPRFAWLLSRLGGVPGPPVYSPVLSEVWKLDVFLLGKALRSAAFD